MKPTQTAAVVAVLLSASIAVYERVQANDARSLLEARTKELASAMAARDFEAAEAARLRILRANPGATAPGKSPIADSGVADAGTAGNMVAVGATQANRAKMHVRYDRLLLGKLHFSDAQAEQFIDLMIQKEDVRADIVAAIKKNGLPGDDPGVQKLRDQLNQPIDQELQALLGGDGYSAYRQFEMQSFYQSAYVDQFAKYIPATEPSLTEQQGDVLASLMSANDHPLPPIGANLSSESHIDWPSVLSQLNGTLTPEQMAALHAYIKDLSRSGH
jgi:hypothetical protein